MAERVATLAQLGLTAKAGREARITGLAVDSRAVRPGYLFAALAGSKSHGADYIPSVQAQGAVAILTDAEGARRAGDLPESVALIVAEEPRAALAMAASLWFGAQPQTMVAVTGTNGKTSVATFARQIWVALGHAAINIGTTGVEGAWAANPGA